MELPPFGEAFQGPKADDGTFTAGGVVPVALPERVAEFWWKGVEALPQTVGRVLRKSVAIFLYLRSSRP